MEISNNICKYFYIKNIFVEDSGICDYINLDKSTIAYHKILNALQKPLKLILFYGKPGTGKTFLLQKIKLDLNDTQDIIFFTQPFFDEIEFLVSVYKGVFHEKPSLELNSFESFMRIYQKRLNFDGNLPSSFTPIVVLLDEAQLYPNNIIEKIRLMADSRLFKFLFTVHKTDEEDVLAKDYFKTRIWESIELPQSTLSEVKLYIEKKLFFHNFYEYFNMFKDEHFELIIKFTDGNLRSVNKLMFKLFELYEFYDMNRATEISDTFIKTKILEMAAIDTGLIDA